MMIRSLLAWNSSKRKFFGPFLNCKSPVARDSSIIPIHRSLHTLVDPVTRPRGVKNSLVGWANSMERGDVGLL